MEETKVIKISMTTDKKLKKLGRFGESYDELIARLIKEKEMKI